MPSTRRHERGAVQVVLLVALIALLGVAALAIDTGFMLATRAQLQAAADAGAHAAVGELRKGVPFGQVKEVGRDLANQNYAAYHATEVTQLDDVVLGSFDPVTGSFQPGLSVGATAVQVAAHRRIPFFFAPVLSLIGLGLDGSDVGAEAVAALGRRDVILVQDVTFSFDDEIEDARNALEQFTMAMVAQSLSGDRIGLVTFNEASNLEQPLTPIPGDASAVLSAIDAFEHCHTSQLPNCEGTHIAPGIETALASFAPGSQSRAERVIVLVSDGVPCLPYDEAVTEQRRQEALAAAHAADEAGVSIYSVFLDKPITGGVYCWPFVSELSEPDLMKELATGNGQFYATPNEEDLDEILVSIVRSMPLRIVD